MKIRVNKFLSQAGIASRRGADVLVENKKVKINDKIAKLGDKVEEDKDIVEVNGKVIKSTGKYIYYAVNKPVGYTSTVRDKYAEKTVTELIPKTPRVYPVGRLDKNSHGLIILTDDGDLTNKLTHPSFKHEKEYVVKIQNSNNKSQIKSQISKLKKGIRLEEGIAKFDKIEIKGIDKIKNTVTLDVVLHQGWKRQIRRMFEIIKCEVLDLKRIRISKLQLQDLEEGKYREVQKNEIID